MARKYSHHTGVILTLCKTTCGYYVQIMVGEHVMATHSLSAWARDPPEPCIASILAVTISGQLSRGVIYRKTEVLTCHFCLSTRFIPFVTLHLFTGQEEHGVT